MVARWLLVGCLKSHVYKDVCSLGGSLWGVARMYGWLLGVCSMVARMFRVVARVF